MRLLHRAARVLNLQSDLLAYKEREIETYKHLLLMHQRSLLDLAIAFRVAVESPEIDIRDDLDTMIRELSDGVAQTEEHVV